MNKENTQSSGKDEQSSGEAVSAPSVSEEMMMLVRRPRPGSVIILVPPDTRMLWSSSEDGLKWNFGIETFKYAPDNPDRFASYDDAHAYCVRFMDL